MSTVLRLTIDDYERMIANGAFVGIDRRIELIHGEMREMSPAGPFHFDYIDYLSRWSFTNVSAKDASIQIQSALLIGDSMPEPDLMWLRPKRYGGDRPRGSDALLVIEVADSSLSYDLGEKANLYASASILDYWVVDVAAKQIHCHRGPTSDEYQDVQVFAADQTLRPLLKPEVELSLDELFGSE